MVYKIGLTSLYGGRKELCLMFRFSGNQFSFGCNTSPVLSCRNVEFKLINDVEYNYHVYRILVRDILL